MLTKYLHVPYMFTCIYIVYMQFVFEKAWISFTLKAYCWPVAGAGRDVVGIAKTGSGKTLAPQSHSKRCPSASLFKDDMYI